MRSDQIFVLMLVIFLPLTGCFGDAIGEAEAEDSDDTTVINNYYYNNTTIVESDNNEPEYFVVGGMIDNNTTMVEVPNQATRYYPYNFSTTSGQTLYIHQLKTTTNSISITSDCGEGGTWTTSATITSSGSHHAGHWVAGSSFDCEHSVKVYGPVGLFSSGDTVPPYYFSMIYSIENMTVIE